MENNFRANLQMRQELSDVNPHILTSAASGRTCARASSAIRRATTARCCSGS
ncbi:MAG: hypothetical protein MET45_30765 [Nostoc sp. LLA-1]|nr:hypothetical protein [Cyanocohniella sp. LLY]